MNGSASGMLAHTGGGSQSDPALSVVVVNYNTRADLQACLTALDASTIKAEIIVVDNASRDGSAEMVRDRFPRVVLIEPGRNTWFCGGNNLGIDAAHGEYVLLLNPDTVIPPDALAMMLDFITTHPDYAGVTMQLRYPTGQIQKTCSRIPTFRYLLLTQTPIGWLLPGLKQRDSAHHWYDIEEWDRTTDFDVEAVPGSCTLMRRGEIRLNDSLLLYFPEEDLARHTGGRRFRFIANPHILHREKSATRSPLAMRIYFRDMITYTRTYHGAVNAAILWVCSRPLKWALEISWKFKR